jgi:hypothetical protein
VRANGHQAPTAPYLPAEERFLRHKRDLHRQLIASMDLSAIGTPNEEEPRVEARLRRPWPGPAARRDRR